MVHATSKTGGDVKASRTETSDYTITMSDVTILADASNNTIDITLPENPKKGQIYNIACINANHTCRILRNNNNIDGEAIDLILARNVSRTLQYKSGYGWKILA